MRVSARDRAEAATHAPRTPTETETDGAFHACSSSALLLRNDSPDTTCAAAAAVLANVESAASEAERFYSCSSAQQLPQEERAFENENTALVVEVEVAVEVAASACADGEREDTDATDSTETELQDTNVDADVPPAGREPSAGARTASGSTLALERIRHEPLLAFLLQVGPPFLLAGLGLVATGAVLHSMTDKSPAFQHLRALNVVIPPLIGLKGDLEMTLAARLSTLANLNRLNTWKAVLRCASANLVLVVGQALWLGGLSGVIGVLLETFGREKEDWPLEVATLLATVLLTAAIASLLLGLLMVAVVVACSRMHINPDNVTSPLAASLGDVTTVVLIAAFGNALYENFYVTGQWWCPALVVLLALVVAAACLVSALRNPRTAALARTGWIPICSSVAFSSVAGWIFDRTLHFRGMTPLMPVVNGVSGDLAGIAVSKLSTELHAERRHRVRAELRAAAAAKAQPQLQLQHAHSTDSVSSALSEAPETCGRSCCAEFESPAATFCAFSSNRSRRSAALLGISVPGHAVFVGCMYLLGYARDTISQAAFFPTYLLAVFLQVGLLICVSLWIARYMWRRGNDPDSYAIPYVTGLGDVSGTSALALTFFVLGFLYPHVVYALPHAAGDSMTVQTLLPAIENGTDTLNITLLPF